MNYRGLKDNLTTTYNMSNLRRLAYDIAVAATWHQSFLCTLDGHNAPAATRLPIYRDGKMGKGRKWEQQTSVGGWLRTRHLPTGCLKQNQLHSQNAVQRQVLNVQFYAVFVTALQYCMECRRGLVMRILSVRPSVKRIDCDKTEEKSVQIFVPCERSFSLVFSEEEWFVAGDPFYLKFWVNRPPLERNRRFWIARSASAVTISEKSSWILSLLYALSNEPKMIIVRCP